MIKNLSVALLVFLGASFAQATSPDFCRHTCLEDSDTCTHYGYGAAIIVNPMLALYKLAQDGKSTQICNRTLELQGDQIVSSGPACETRMQYGADAYLRTVIPAEMRAVVMENAFGTNDVFFTPGKALFNEIRNGHYYTGGNLDFISISAEGPHREIIWGTEDGYCFAAPWAP